MKHSLTKKDKFLLLSLFILFLAAGYTGFIWLGEITLVLLVVTISTTVLTILFEFYRRLYGISTQIKEQQTEHQLREENNYRQIESAFSLFFTIQPELPLPDMRGWVASPDFLKRIVEEVICRKPGLVVEASSGVSTLMVAYALKKNGRGKVISLENDKKYYAKTKELIRNHNLNEYSSPVYAPLKEIAMDGNSFKWYDTDSLNIESPINMLIVDGPIGSLQELSRYPALPRFYNDLDKNAVILLDDGNRRDEQEIVKLWESKYPDIRSEYLNFEKGGFILSRKRAALE